MSRRQARQVAVETLYASELRNESVADVLLGRLETPQEGPAVSAYAQQLLTGVGERRAQIDDLLERNSQSWPLPRMSAVDRNVLRVAVFELLDGEAPPAVVLDEAVELAKRFSGGEAGRFVNGVLSGVLRELSGERQRARNTDGTV